MPDVTRTEIGRRMFQLQKEKSVERIIEKIRRNPGADWKSFSDDEVRQLERLLGEAWVSFEQSAWEKIPFARMTREDVQRILAIGKYMDLDKTPHTQIIDELKKVLRVSL